MQFVIGVLSGLYDIAGSIGGGKTMIGSLVACAFGIFLTGSRAVVVETYSDHRHVKTEHQGGVEAITDRPFGRFLGNVLKLAGMVIFTMGVFAFASHMHY